MERPRSRRQPGGFLVLPFTWNISRNEPPAILLLIMTSANSHAKTPEDSNRSGVFGLDAYAPKEIAEKIETIGVTKARLPILSQITLGLLAGGFIGLGALYFTIVVSDASLTFATSRILGGIAFSFG